MDLKVHLKESLMQTKTPMQDKMVLSSFSLQVTELLAATSFARAFVKALIPPFVVEYKTSQEAPASPQMEEILMIFPSW